MINLTGKTLIFTDIHFGIRDNQQSRLKICINVIKNIIQFIEKNNVTNCIFLGDYFHVRSQISVDTINIAYKCMKSLANRCNVYMIIGNHDIFLKNSVDINSIKIFSDINNVTVVDQPTEISINKNNSLLLPWLSDVSKFKSQMQYDMLFGHFDISTDFLIKQYIEQNSKEKNNKKNTDDSIGDFIDLARIDGTVFSGHIHTRRQFRTKNRNFIFVGSPYQQNLGEIGNTCGFYIIDERNEIAFHQIDGIPRHIDLKVSKIIEETVEKFDFSIVTGNIVHKIYDVEIDKSVDTIIQQKILDMHPYEELLPDYDIQINDSDAGIEQSEVIDLLRKSKLEYVRNYIDNISDEAMSKDQLSKDKLYQVVESYYNKITQK